MHMVAPLHRCYICAAHLGTLAMLEMSKGQMQLAFLYRAWRGIMQSCHTNHSVIHLGKMAIQPT